MSAERLGPATHGKEADGMWPPPVVEWRREDDGLWEHRTEVLAVAYCVVCGEAVQLEAETEEWVEDPPDSERWHHASYGPSMNTCCRRLYVHYWEGLEVFSLEGTNDEKRTD